MAIILASGSPRRQELMFYITEDFTVLEPNIDEYIPPNTTPQKAVELLSTAKAMAVFTTNPTSVVIGCDTIVEIDGEILGKPQTQEEAAKMLFRLSGRTHRVYTGTTVAYPGGYLLDCQVAEVTFHKLTKADIVGYVRSGEPMDKAGAYGIQGIGALLVKEIKGDFYTIVGLPISTLGRMLEKIGEIETMFNF